MATTKKVTVNATTGISEAGIPKIVTAIGSYKNEMKKKIDISLSKKQIEAAIKGTMTEGRLKSALAELEASMESLLNLLDENTAALESSIKNRYTSHDESNAAFDGLNK